MALNLKRKRSEPTASRKVRKFQENEHSVDDESSHGSDAAQSDEEEWTGITPITTVPSENYGKSGGKPNRPPTGEELRVIKDATDLFRSSSFKLQIDALLPNVRPKTSKIPPLDRFLLSLHTFILSIASISQRHPLEAARKLLKKGVAVPYTLPLPTEETNWKVGYSPPNDITLVGSWANKISVKQKDGLKYGVDLAVEMPDDLFQEKDYLNGRFFQKRAFYLAAIAAAIKSSKQLKVDVFYESPSGDPRLTNLVLIPQKDSSSTDFTKLNAKVVIMPTLSNNCPIPLNRLSPSHSNLRLSASASSQQLNQTSTQPQPRQIPSPTYNTALLRALAPRLHLLSIHNLQQESSGFSDAVTLLRVWANQRGFAESAESKLCVHGFEGRGAWWSAVVSLIVLGEEGQSGKNKFKQRKALGRGLSSYQMFKAVLDFLAKFEFEKEAVFVKSTKEPRFSLEEYDVEQQSVFVDTTSLVNILSGVPRGSLELLRYEASKTIEILNQPIISGDSFTEVFLKDHRNLLTRFDSILRIDLSDANPQNLSLDETMDKGSAFNALLLSIDKLLHRGLGDRTKAITILNPSPSPRPINQALPSTSNVIYIGLIHHPQHATRLVDHGPAADEKDQNVVTAFRDLWGEKAELRRFKDGRILESVVWDVKTVDERAHVPSLIVQFLLQRHFSIGVGSAEDNPDVVRGWPCAFDAMTRLPEEVSKVYLNSGLPVGYKNALTAFDGVVRAIKDLDDELPLATLNVSPVCEALRYTSVFAPVPLPETLAGILPATARYLPHMELIVEFEKSSKWPDDLKAIQKIKLAFFEKVAGGLMKSTPGLKARVVVGDGPAYESNPVLDQSFLEVITPEGWAFAIRIWNSREAVLLDRIISGQDKFLPHIKPLHKEKQQQGKEYHDAVYAKEVYTRRFIHGPRHHRAIAALSHRYSAYAGTVRLVKRWLAAHWVLGPGRVSEEAVELICAKVFVGEDGKYVAMDVDSEAAIKQPGVPGSKERGFACVVQFLREWKWEEGVDVPLYNAAESQSPVEGVEEGEEAGEAAGSVKGKQMNGRLEGKEVKASGTSAWTISTDFDKEGKMWTSGGPDVVVARRIKTLAQATWDYLQNIEQGNINVQALFIHPTDDYDFVIHLEPSALPRYLHNVTVKPEYLTKRGRYANKMLEEHDTNVRPGFDPAAMFFIDLQRVYTDTFKIFCDPYGGDHLGVVWDPSVAQPRPFRVLGGFSSEPLPKESGNVKDKSLVSLNQDAILSEVERLGKGLITRIVKQK